MLRKKKFIIVFISVLIFTAFIKNIYVKADSNKENLIGTYMISVPVKVPTKTYVQKELVDYLKSEGIYVRSEKRNLFVKDYYYIANKYVEKIVYSRELSNDIDSVIFMVSELEKIAIEVDSGDYKNLVLGYLRSFNKDYYNGWFGAWSYIAGEVNQNFVKEVKEREKNKIGIKIDEFFAQFVQCSKYNVELHGQLNSEYIRDKQLMLKEPYDNTKSIDLIHMFASIDGIYLKTLPVNYFNKPETIGRNMQRDLTSWNGDLQTAVKEINKKYGANNLPKYDENTGKMKLIFSKNDLGDDIFCCSEEDILADIDAMNICKFFLDHDNNTISKSLNAYYGIVKNNKNIRYKTFIKTVIIDEEKPLKNKSDFERFENEVLIGLNLKKQNGVIVDNKSATSNVFLGYSIMRDDKFKIGIINGKEPEIKLGEMPHFNIREFVAKSFIEYVKENIS